jgi:hypothetical protein
LEEKMTEKQLSELRKEVLEICGPLENAAFEAGRKKGIAEALANPHAAAASIASPGQKPAGSHDPVALAARARKLQAEAAGNGEELSNAAAVRMAYAEAGLPLQ